MRHLLSLMFIALAPVACNSGDGSSDFDRDGSDDSVDCAPEDPAIHSGASEDCSDGLDNDCDSWTDCADTDCLLLSDCDSGDDDTGDDDTSDEIVAVHAADLCAAVGRASNSTYTAIFCTGPVDMGVGASTNGKYRLVTGAMSLVPPSEE